MARSKSCARQSLRALLWLQLVLGAAVLGYGVYLLVEAGGFHGGSGGGPPAPAPAPAAGTRPRRSGAPPAQESKRVPLFSFAPPQNGPRRRRFSSPTPPPSSRLRPTINNGAAQYQPPAHSPPPASPPAKGPLQHSPKPSLIVEARAVSIFDHPTN